ncbi:hypothetical protein QJS10_CPB13g00156 [Acorus calamus]|uniref:Uncharacterized protein n=1 Tax=Acorus calamus TaxID=4465 RepID=A0AAV9DIN7_ACOCL|nr:hypothetical protein QJS10_CPB13g00156 [Acorus calamus]
MKLYKREDMKCITVGESISPTVMIIGIMLMEIALTYVMGIAIPTVSAIAVRMIPTIITVGEIGFPDRLIKTFLSGSWRSRQQWGSEFWSGQPWRLMWFPRPLAK